jgi:predicted hydrocarbon binding protein
MDRKTFFQKFFQGGLIATLAGGLKIPGLRAEDSDAASLSMQDQFRHRWIGSLLKNFSKMKNSDEGISLLESCGRDCARSGAIQMAVEADKNVDNLLNKLKTHLGEENAVRDGKRITIQYPKCYCPLVSGMTPQKDSAWCNCSRGWLLEMFETVTGKPAQVELKQSILRGDERCRFEIRIS